MQVRVTKDSEQLGVEAAKLVADILNQAIAEKGTARLLLSTGASQFDTLKALIKMNVAWEHVEMFHLDEYIYLPETHPASFRKYLKERFIKFVNLKSAYLVDGEGDIEKNIKELTNELKKEPIDIALIGIGENAHIAFNDPPADFDTKESYIVVDLDQRCKQQQVGEGWFNSLEEVPKQAISMTVYQIMQSKVIVSCVPSEAKANAVKLTLENELTNQIPATMLKEHERWTLFIDQNSASLVDREVVNILEK